MLVRSRVFEVLSRPVLRETVILVLICFLDTAHTLTVVHLGVAREANPVVAWALAHSDLVFVLFKVGLTVAILLALEHIRTYCSGFVMRAMRFGICGYLGVYAFGSLALAHGLGLG